MHAAENDHVRVGLLSVVTQSEGVAYVVGHVLNFTNLIVMRQDDSVAFLFETPDFFGQIRSRLERWREEGIQCNHNGLNLP